MFHPGRAPHHAPGTASSRIKERAAVRRAAAAKESFKAVADAQAALAHAHEPPRQRATRVGGSLSYARAGTGMKGVWRDPEQIDFFDPADYERAAVKAYHDALPQWLRDRMHARAIARSGPPTESERVCGSRSSSGSSFGFTHAR